MAVHNTPPDNLDSAVVNAGDLAHASEYNTLRSDLNTLRAYVATRAAEQLLTAAYANDSVTLDKIADAAQNSIRDAAVSELQGEIDETSFLNAIIFG